MTTIRNFGHYWSRSLIDWGWQGRPGSLLGALRANADESDADFRNQIGIYVLYDENREAIYVGQAGRGNSRLFDRLRQHSRGPMRDRWTAFSWFGFLDVGPDGYLIEREDSAIPAHTHMDWRWLLLARYQGQPMIRAEVVYSDYFSPLTFKAWKEKWCTMEPSSCPSCG